MILTYIMVEDHSMAMGNELPNSLGEQGDKVRDFAEVNLHGFRKGLLIDGQIEVNSCPFFVDVELEVDRSELQQRLEARG